MNPIILKLPYPPSTNRIWRKNPNGGMYRSAEYKLFMQLVSLEVRAKSNPSYPIKSRVSLELVAHAADNRPRDLDNLAKATQDALVKCGLLYDDSLIDRLVIIRGKNSVPPFILARITPIDSDV